MRVLVADDHDLVRDTIAAYLEREGDMTVTVVASFDEAIAAIRTSAPFDLILLDYSMPGMNGLGGMKAASAESGGKPVALISGIATREIAQEALQAGAAGFIPKTLPAKSLVNAVRFMMMGETFAPVTFMTAPEPEAPQNPLAARLTERERQVLEGLCRGLSNKEIARELDLQEVTVKLHVRTLCRKIDAKNRTHAAMIAKDVALI